ncbi:MAG: transcriptional regulator [Polyangia bacterium]
MSAFPSLTSLFVPHLPAALRPLLARPESLEERLRTLLTTATAAWPELSIPPQEFLSFLAQQLAAGDLEAQLEQLQVAELYLTCGCLRRDPRALAAFERTYLGQLDRALASMPLGAQLQDVKQRVRQLLLVARPGAPPKLATYSGRGKLTAWLRVVAVREALDLIARERGEPACDPEQAAALPVEDDDPELGYMKRTYRAAFKAALERALRSLPARAQNLLRQQILDGLTVTELGALYKVHHATAARWLVDARRELVRRTRNELKASLRLTTSECDSILRLAQDRLEVSISRLLRHTPAS